MGELLVCKSTDELVALSVVPGRGEFIPQAGLDGELGCDLVVIVDIGGLDVALVIGLRDLNRIRCCPKLPEKEVGEPGPGSRSQDPRGIDLRGGIGLEGEIAAGELVAELIKVCRSYSKPRSTECLPCTQLTLSLIEISGSVVTYGPSVLSPRPLKISPVKLAAGMPQVANSGRKARNPELGNVVIDALRIQAERVVEIGPAECGHVDDRRRDGPRVGTHVLVVGGDDIAAHRPARCREARTRVRFTAIAEAEGKLRFGRLVEIAAHVKAVVFVALSVRYV